MMLGAVRATRLAQEFPVLKELMVQYVNIAVERTRKITVA